MRSQKKSLTEQIKYNFNNNKNIKISSSEYVEKYGQLIIESNTEKGSIEKDYFIKCLEVANKFNDSVSNKNKMISIKFINFDFKENVIEDNSTNELIKIDIYYEDCKFMHCSLNNLEFSKCISFKKCYFDTTIFENSLFKKEFVFENCEIKNKANFSNTKFINNAYFNNSKFSDYADFHEAEFEAVACFYGAKFEKPMNFSSVVFKDFNKANFVNSNIKNINYESIRDGVKDNYKIDEQYKKEICDKIKDYRHKKNFKEYKKEKEAISLKYKIKWANNFRDSFRVIKHSLIETNNNLEASNFHKLELYAKEIELKYKIPIINNIDKIDYCISKSTFMDYIVNIAFYIPLLILNLIYYTFCIFSSICEIIKKDFTNFVDCLLLELYRNTSEHHTNFTRVLNFTVMIIAIYGIFIICLKKQPILYPASMYINYIAFILGMITGFISANKKFETIYLSIGTSIWIILIMLSCSIAFLFKIEYALVILNSLMYILSFLFAFILFVNKNIIITILTRALSYAMLLFILYVEPSIIIPFSNFNSNSQNQYLQTKLSQANKTEIVNLASIINPEFNATKNPNSSENLSISELNEYKKFIVENKEILKDSDATNAKFKQAIYADSSRDKTIKCISFIYAIILGLCLFSLQKTARRNSVVPS
ncbi:MAG: pentapeptide repeat-containing protein [Campylobacter sp.]|nr:pentapeptide repeat-containing protein [Campylobacter sp.]